MVQSTIFKETNKYLKFCFLHSYILTFIFSLFFLLLLNNVDWKILKKQGLATKDILRLNSRISHYDSFRDGTKHGARENKIELDELYRMLLSLFLSNPRKPEKNPKYYHKITNRIGTPLVKSTTIRPLR